MIPQRIQGANLRLTLADENVAPLMARREEFENGTVMVTAWEPTPEEIQRLIAGAPVHLSLLADGHPPVRLDVGAPPDDGGVPAPSASVEREAREISERIANKADMTILEDDTTRALYFGNELAGEVGELLNALKKQIRDGAENDDHIAEEMADVYLTLLNFARSRGVDLEAATRAKLAKLRRRWGMEAKA